MIGVVGSLNMDLVARVPRLPAPGETVLGGRLERYPGGKGGNQAVAAARLGASVTFFGAVGDDGFGSELADGLVAEGIDAAGLLCVPGPSGCALINVGAGGENTISVLPGANALAPLPPPSLPPALRALLVQLELPLPTILAWVEAARSAGLAVTLNAAPMLQALPPALLRGVDTLVVNEIELRALAGGELAAAAALGPPRVIVTRGAQGAAAIDQGRRLEQPAPRTTVVDSTGAGDCFAGALVAALWQGRAFDEALARAVAAASLSCTRAGARGGMPTAAELDAAMGRL